MVSVRDVVQTTLDSFSTPLIYAVLLASAFVFIIAYFARPRRIYFVRHGETEANARGVRQDDKGPLSAKGRAQVASAAAYLAQFPIQEMVASPFERTKESAAIINETLHVPLTYSPLLAERKNPSEVIGKSEDDPAIRNIMDTIDRMYHADEYRYSDEENFVDLRDRAKRCLMLLSRQSALHLAAVTHGIYLKMIIGYLLYREDLHAGEYTKLSFFNASDNAGITICEYEPLKRLNKTRGWRVVDYNVTPYENDKPPTAPLGIVPRIPGQLS